MSFEVYVSAEHSGLISWGRPLRIYSRARSKRFLAYLVTSLLSDVLGRPTPWSKGRNRNHIEMDGRLGD